MPIKTRFRLLTSSGLSALMGIMPPAQALAGSSLPTGGTVAAGSATVQSSTTSLTVNQTSDRAVINWQGFSIGAGNSVTFVQPGSTSATLNRVTGDTPSSIAGSLASNGSVYLINPNGIQITSGGVVKTGSGFVASTLDLADSDFMAGRNSFSGAGASKGVVNNGAIATGPGGFVALLGGTVANNGVIVAPLGSIGLGSGEQAMLDVNGGQFLQVAIPTRATMADGQALVTNAGKLRASGGQVVLTAATARSAVRDAINMPGSISAGTVSGRNGSIMLGGGAGGIVRVTGALKATSRKNTGGKVSITGKQIAVNGATIDVSGANGGGSVSIGGKGTANQADSVSLDAASSLHADATGAGNGGSVVLWSTGLTTAHGLITATGGSNGGSGGSVETSGETVNFDAITVNTRAPAGHAGTWLIDPTDLTIDATAAAAIDAALINNDVTLTTSAAGVPAATGVLGATGNTTGSGQGDITVASPLSWSSAHALALNAYNAIIIDAPITIAGAGTLNLNYNAAQVGNLSFGLSNTGFTGSVSYTGVGGALNVNGIGYTLLYSMSDVGTINNNLAGNYALAGNLDAGSSTYSAAVVGGPTLSFSGAFDGLGHTISNLTIHDPTENGYLGLFGQASGTIRNTGLLNVSVSGGPNGSLGGFYNALNIGSLVGDSTGAISQSYATGSVSGGPGNEKIGGLVGTGDGSISQSFAHVSVSGQSAEYVGGLMGYGAATISQSYATGDVSGDVNGGLWSTSIGGLVGYSLGAISQSYATGAVSGGDHSGLVGGLVGQSFATISNSYATGAVSAKTYSSDIGGLVGYSSGNISLSYATGTVTGGYASNTLGGLVGSADGNMTISLSYATGAVTAGDASSFIGGLLGIAPFSNSGITIADSHATGAVNAGNSSAAIGGLVGLSDSNTSITRSYATGDVTAGASAQYIGGLVGSNAGTISQSHATGAVKGGDYATDIGGLAGTTGGTTVSITGSYASGSVAGGYNASSIGGLVGDNETISTIENSHATGAVTGGDTSYQIGGLVGINRGTVDMSYATGLVSAGTGVTAVGGLVGFNDAYASVTYSAATGNVTVADGSTQIGGLAGYNGGYIYNYSYSSGAVSAAGASSYIGGLVGFNDAGSAIGVVWATGNVSAGDGASFIGGLAGLNIGYVLQAYAWGSVTGGAGSHDIGGLVGSNYNSNGEGTISQSYSAGSVSGGSGAYNIGGLAGSAVSTDISQSYWDTVTSGQASSSGGAGLTTAQLKDLAAQPDGGSIIDSNHLGAPFLVGGGSYPVFFLTNQPTSITYTTANGTTVQYGNFTLADLGSVTFSGNPANLGGIVSLYTTDTNGVLSGLVTNPTQYLPAGTYYEGVSSLTGSAQSQYVLATSGNTIGTIVINPAPVTVTGSQIYNGGTSILGSGLTVSGLLNNDPTLIVVGISATGALSSANASQTAQSVTLGAGNVGGLALSGTGASNYTLVGATANVTITPASLVITPSAQVKTYGQTGSSSTATAFSETGLVNGDTITGLSLASSGLAATAVVGSYNLTGSAATGTGLGNYAITYATGTNALSVTPASLTYVADSATRYVGIDNPAFTGRVTGFVNADSLASATTGSLVFTSPATAASPSGTYGIFGSGLSATNYIFVQASGNATALSIKNLDVPDNVLTGSYFPDRVTPMIKVSNGGVPLAQGAVAGGRFDNADQAEFVIAPWVASSSTQNPGSPWMQGR